MQSISEAKQRLCTIILNWNNSSMDINAARTFAAAFKSWVSKREVRITHKEAEETLQQLKTLRKLVDEANVSDTIQIPVLLMIMECCEVLVKFITPPLSLSEFRSIMAQRLNVLSKAPQLGDERFKEVYEDIMGLFDHVVSDDEGEAVLNLIREHGYIISKSPAGWHKEFPEDCPSYPTFDPINEVNEIKKQIAAAQAEARR